MNKIVELAKQADLIEWDTLPSGARTPDYESVAKAKKFAELIIHECLDTIQAGIDNFGSSDPKIKEAGQTALTYSYYNIQYRFKLGRYKDDTQPGTEE